MSPVDFSSVLPVGGYTEKNYNDADTYSRNKLLQQQISSLVAFEPVTYAFVNITNEGIDGWKSLGIEVERGQAIAPFYKITYDVDKLDCSKFSCLPIDIRDNTNGIGSCNFKKTPAIDVSFGLKNETYTACGDACYILNKKIDPHTGLPKASGNLMIKGDNGICNYINQNLLLWGTLPQSRATQSGDVINGYNDTFVPPFDVVDNGLYNNLEITNAYCQYFKRWFNNKEKKCYRSSWMKVLHMAFGTAISNVFFPQNCNMIKNAKTRLGMRKLNLKQPNVEKITEPNTSSSSSMAIKLYDNSLDEKQKALAAVVDILASSFLSDNDDNESLTPRHDVLSTTKKTIDDKLQSHKKDTTYPMNQGEKTIPPFNYIKSINVALKKDVVNFIKQKENNNNNNGRNSKYQNMENIEEKAENIIEMLMDFAVTCKVHKISDYEARRLILSKILQMCRKERCIQLSEALQIITLYSKIKNTIFPNIHPNHHHDNNGNTNKTHPIFKNDDDLKMFIDDRYKIYHPGEKSANIEEKKARPSYIIQMVKSITDSSNTSIHIPSLLGIYPFISPIKKTLTNIAFHLWNDFHDMISPDWARYNKDFSYDNNFFVVLIVDNIIHKSLSCMANFCRSIIEKLSVRTIETLASRGALMAEDALVTVFSRMVLSTAQRLAVDFLVRGALVTALEIFTELVALVAGILDGIGILFIVGSILGMVLDLALNMAWYENVMTPEILASHVKNYVTAFKSTTDLTSGEIAPVTPKDLIEIAINSEMNNADENDHNTSSGNQEDDYESFLNTYFDEKPLIGSRTDTFLQEAYFEYLGTKTMNSLGQPLSRRPNATVTTFLEGGKENIIKLLHTGSKYTDMVSYNASRVTAYNLESKEDKHHFTRLNSLQDSSNTAKWTVLGAGVILLIGSLFLTFCIFTSQLNEIATIVFFITLLVYIFLFRKLYLAIVKTKLVIHDFIKNSLLFNLNESNLMNYKDVDRLKANSASVRYYFSEFTKPYTNFLLTQ
uniref:Wsv115-like protein n=1 Tax=Melicertus latisulcatus majanivirus TaxID=2984277 RepID=A0A9C7F6P7_9VIRU|nr:MAG: wsv115-like protein [Melicertus latisulcatus majanivirus]